MQSCTSIDIIDAFFNWLLNTGYQYVYFLCRFLKVQAMWTSVMLSMSCHLAQSIQEFITHWMKLQGYFMTQVEPSNTISRLVTIHLAFVIKHVREKASKSQHLGNIANIGWRELGSFTNVHIHVTICMSSSMWAKGKLIFPISNDLIFVELIWSSTTQHL